ncbi:HAMP domain-containing protein [Brachybacterium sp. GPGPB12]|uniref:HAMP domain-containing protein n=1 Tax=Brachybacterium sp. GPGPB12 TaxID=3023517 RepID=UPI00313428E3
MRPLDRFRSFKVKLGILVGVSVTVAASLTQVSIRAGIEPLLSLPLVVIAALVSTQPLARGMTSPLRQMTAAAQAMARGDYSGPVRATSRDEVGRLAEAFSVMAAELEQTDRTRRDLVANVSHERARPSRACAPSWRTSSTASPSRILPRSRWP